MREGDALARGCPGQQGRPATARSPKSSATALARCRRAGQGRVGLDGDQRGPALRISRAARGAHRGAPRPSRASRWEWRVGSWTGRLRPHQQQWSTAANRRGDQLEWIEVGGMPQPPPRRAGERRPRRPGLDVGPCRSRAAGCPGRRERARWPASASGIRRCCLEPGPASRRRPATPASMPPRPPTRSRRRHTPVDGLAGPRAEASRRACSRRGGERQGRGPPGRGSASANARRRAIAWSCAATFGWPPAAGADALTRTALARSPGCAVADDAAPPHWSASSRFELEVRGLRRGRRRDARGPQDAASRKVSVPCLHRGAAAAAEAQR